MEIQRGPTYTNIEGKDAYYRITQNLDAIYANLEAMAGGNANVPTDNSGLLKKYAEIVALISPKIVQVPASNTAPGTFGQIAIAAGFLYVCVANNSWQRATLANF